MKRARSSLSRIAAVICLDSVTGHPKLSALTAGHPAMTDLVRRTASRLGIEIGELRGFMPNSDHGSFQAAGIPGLRMIAGYGDPESATRFLLTPLDRREIVDLGQLKSATTVCLAMTYLACAGGESTD